MHAEVDQYFNKHSPWQEALNALRVILLECQLTETLKWHAPCYTFNGANVAIIGTLKDCCVLSFFKGALLKDTLQILAAPGANTRSARIIRFTSAQEVNVIAPVLKDYIQDAIAVEQAGVKVFPMAPSPHDIPDEFTLKLQQHPALKKAFEALTPGRQRAYLLHFSQPKQSKTREARIAKYLPRILAGKGLMD